MAKSTFTASLPYKKRKRSTGKYYPMLERLWMKHYGLNTIPSYINCMIFLNKVMYVTREINVINSDDQAKQVARHLCNYLKKNYGPTPFYIPPTASTEEQACKPVTPPNTPPPDVYVPPVSPTTLHSMWKNTI